MKKNGFFGIGCLNMKTSEGLIKVKYIKTMQLELNRQEQNIVINSLKNVAEILLNKKHEGVDRPTLTGSFDVNGEGLEVLFELICQNKGYHEGVEGIKKWKEHPLTNKILEHNRKLYKSIAADFEDIEEKGILYKSDLLKMPLPAETVNDLQDWFLEMCELV